MDDCLFCKIIDGEVPSHKVYEDNDVSAFLDINPVNPGHTLVVPKKHYENLYETPDEALAKLMAVVRKLAVSIRSGLNADGTNIEMHNDEISGQLISHTHIHIIPRFEGDKLKLFPRTEYKEGEIENITEKIRKQII